jgi:hypothetical protein
VGKYKKSVVTYFTVDGIVHGSDWNNAIMRQNQKLICVERIKEQHDNARANKTLVIGTANRNNGVSAAYLGRQYLQQLGNGYFSCQ